MNAHQIGWDNLQFFLATARGATLVAAAETLGVNHSTVHRRIAALEEQMKTKLFDRSPQGYSLTPAGEELVEHVLSIEQEILAIGRKVVGRDQSLAGTVRVATVDDLAVSVLPPILEAFRARHPSVTVLLDIHSDFADLAALQADVAIRFGALPESGPVMTRRVGAVRTMVYGSTEYLDSRGRPEHPEDLGDHDIVRGDERFARLPAEQLLDRHTTSANVALRSNSMLTRLAAVRCGLGIGFLPYFMASREPSLERLDLDLEPTGADIWMLLHADVRNNARVRAFVDFTYEKLVDQRSLFDPA